MKIVTSDDQNPGDAIITLMERAAELALSRGGIGHSDCEVSLSFVSPEEMRALNAEYRGMDEVTDVLSFPMYESAKEIRDTSGALDFSAASPDGSKPSNTADPLRFAGARPQDVSHVSDAENRELAMQISEDTAVLLGDVVICIEVAERQAEEIGQSVERELLYLFVHSMFHLLGYDHMDEESRGAMRAAEEDVLGELE